MHVRLQNKQTMDIRDKYKVNLDDKNRIDKIKCFALDMDGTIYLGTEWIDGALDFLNKVEISGRDYIFLTNNSSKNPDAYVDKLAKMGLVVTKDKVISSGDATIAYVLKNYPQKKVYLLGNSLLRKQFIESGITLVDDDHELSANYACGREKENVCDLVVVGFDTELDYKKMCIVCDYVRAGVPYISTHPDYNCPTETGFIPDAGSIHAFIEASTGRKPDAIIGKPNAGIIDYLLERTGMKREELAMVGDRLYTDVAAGVNNGLTGVLVLSGEATLEDIEESEVIPHLVFDSIKNIIPYL